MGHHHSPRLRNGLLLAAIAGGLVPIGAPAQAQAQTGASEPTITITAPRRTRLPSRSVNEGIELLSLSAAVGYRDLNLRTPDGRTALEKRVRDAAQEVCQELDRKYPGGTPDVRTCARDAHASAKRQIDAAVAKAG